MLTDGRIDSLDTHLEQFKLNNQTAQNDMQDLLREYGQLLVDYKRLKRDFETKGAKPAAKAAALSRIPAEKEKRQNPYVLVLVDGNGYIFNDELIREKEEGGMRAARMMNDTVEKYLQQSVPQARASRVVVRVYADLTNLSKQLAKSKVTGLEKRSIAPFTAGFTRAMSLFDFVDTLDEEGTKFKIREQFNMASEDKSCTHILFAACHDSAYLSQLVPLSGIRDKVTLVQGAGWNSEFHQYNLNVTQFPTVFRWSELPTSVLSTKAAPTNGSVTPKPNAAPKKSVPNVPTGPRQNDPRANNVISSNSAVMESDGVPIGTNGFNTSNSVNPKTSGAHKSSQQPCKYFQKGYCRFGNDCTFQHVPTPSINTNQQPSRTGADRSRISTILPTSTASGYIPLNKHNQRLDNYIRPPSQEEWAIYNTRFHKQKPCNNFHLQRVCTTYGCPYDHHDLEPEARHVLEYVLKCNACPKKGECRASDCFYGHLCQKDGCQGQLKGCRMKSDLHSVDPKVVNIVPAEGEEGSVHGHIEGVQMPVDNEYFW